MKKNLLLISAIALLMASCSSDEPAISDLQKPEYAAANSYLNINLRNANGMAPKMTRATDDNPYDQGNGKYEDGTGYESKITQVRFYFFNEEGTPFAVRQDVVNNLYENYVDWFPNSTEFGDPNHTETVEQTLNATLGLTLIDDEERPYMVLAVANPTKELLSYSVTNDLPNMAPSCMSLSDLQGVVNDYIPANNQTPFVMSNSVYVENKEPVYATVIDSESFQPTPALAADHVVKIFIERVLARVDFGISTEMPVAKLTDADGNPVDGTFYSLGGYTLNDGDTGENAMIDEQIYVQFLGWNVTSTTNKSYLVKNINPEWGDDAILGTDTPWYISQLHRSFWAMNPNGVTYQFGNFGNVTTENFPEPTTQAPYATALNIAAAGAYTTTYIQENANPYSLDKVAAKPSDPSKVIIAAQLVDSYGKPLTICQYQNVNYTLDGLKNQLAKQLGSLYYKTTQNGQNAWAQIEPGMLTFTTVDPAGNVAGDKEYHVYAVLTEEAEGKIWGSSNDGGVTVTPLNTENADEPNSEAANRYIRSKLTSIMIWNSGLTYYFFDIEHLGINNQQIGFLGIVRNHIYRTTVTSVKGLGTPVYNPGLVIHPEKTESEETIIKFVIEPLSWRLVSSSYELNWE